MWQVRTSWLLMWALAMVSSMSLAATSLADEKIVEAVGEGIDEADARTKAVRSALETYAGTELASKTEVENFQLKKDMVIARTSGLVSWVEGPTFRKKLGGTVEARGKLKIKEDIIDTTWAEVEELMRGMGRPKILFVYQETIYDLDRPESKREVVQSQSQLQTQITDELTRLGFSVLEGAALDKLKALQERDAKALDNVDLLLSAAKTERAQIIVVGKARATGPEVSVVGGRPGGAGGVRLYNWKTDITLRAYWAETGETLVAVADANVPGASDVAGPPGAAKALINQGRKTTNKFVFDMLTKWSQQLTGGGEIVLQVSDIPSFRVARRIRTQLMDIKNVSEVIQSEYAKGAVTTYSVRTTETAARFADKVDALFDELNLEITNQRGKTIEATYTIEADEPASKSPAKPAPRDTDE